MVNSTDIHKQFELLVNETWAIIINLTLDDTYFSPLWVDVNNNHIIYPMKIYKIQMYSFSIADFDISSYELETY